MKTYKLHCNVTVDHSCVHMHFYRAHHEPIFSFALKHIVSGQPPLQGIAVEVITR